MKRSTNRKVILKRIAALLITLCAASLAQEYTAGGELALPDYRKWVYLGSGLGMSYTGVASKEPPFTNVFAEPSAYEAFMKNGVWPDKTVLIAEMRGSQTGLSIAKNGFAQTENRIAVEAEVKDASKGGWAFYGFENGKEPGIRKTGKLFAKTVACYSCHEQHASTDNTFVQFYPTLIATAKAHGNFKSAGEPAGK